MLEKAIILADTSLEFIYTQYPADDPKFHDLIKSITETRVHLKRLEIFLAELEHKQKTSLVGVGPCTCPKCDQTKETERSEFAECLKEVAMNEIKGTPDLVYARDETKLAPVFKNTLSIHGDDAGR